jgi:polar amino acid transport system substrate-binding protein
VAVLIRYQPDVDRSPTIDVHQRPRAGGRIGISLIGCGNHVLGKHLPNLRRIDDVEIRGIASATGRNASMVADRVDATMITTDVAAVVEDPDADVVMICSAQPEHFEHISAALDAGKAIFVEKPMVTVVDDFAQLLRRMENEPVLFTLGLNRRYSPIVRRLRDAIEGPIDSVEYTITQPYLPPDHWTVDPVDGGGRLITEGEHFLDLCTLLIGRRPLSVFARALGNVPDDLRTLCNFAITVHYEGAVANIVFNESGAAKYPRERVTVLARGQVATLDDFAKLTVHGNRVRGLGTGLRKSMGHAEELEQLVAALQGRHNHLLTWDEASLATLCMFAAQDSIRSGEAVNLDEFRKRLLDGPPSAGDDAGQSSAD